MCQCKVCPQRTECARTIQTSARAPDGACRSVPRRSRRSCGLRLARSVGVPTQLFEVDSLAPGMPLEGARYPVAHPVTDMRGGGKFGLACGQFTDDSSMALCLAESIIVKRDFNPADQMQRYVEWYRNGHMSSNGICFGTFRSHQVLRPSRLRADRSYKGQTLASAHAYRCTSLKRTRCNPSQRPRVS